MFFFSVMPTGPNPVAISIPVPKKSPTTWILYNDFAWYRRKNVLITFFCNREYTSITAQLQTRKFGQAPILSQALSFHLHVLIMILWDSMNFLPVKQLFQIDSAGDWTTDPWITSPTLSPTPRGILQKLTYLTYVQK